MKIITTMMMLYDDDDAKDDDDDDDVSVVSNYDNTQNTIGDARCFKGHRKRFPKLVKMLVLYIKINFN